MSKQIIEYFAPVLAPGDPPARPGAFGRLLSVVRSWVGHGDGQAADGGTDAAGVVLLVNVGAPTRAPRLAAGESGYLDYFAAGDELAEAPKPFCMPGAVPVPGVATVGVPTLRRGGGGVRRVPAPRSAAAADSDVIAGTPPGRAGAEVTR